MTLFYLYIWNSILETPIYFNAKKEYGSLTISDFI